MPFNHTSAGVYSICHRATGRRYIGSSENIRSRFNSHKAALRSHSHFNTVLQNFYSSHESDQWDCSIVELIDRSYAISQTDFSKILRAQEGYWMNELQSHTTGFNTILEYGKRRSGYNRVNVNQLPLHDKLKSNLLPNKESLYERLDRIELMDKQQFDNCWNDPNVGPGVVEAFVEALEEEEINKALEYEERRHQVTTLDV